MTVQELAVGDIIEVPAGIVFGKTRRHWMRVDRILPLGRDWYDCGVIAGVEVAADGTPKRWRLSGTSIYINVYATIGTRDVPKCTIHKTATVTSEVAV